MTLITGTIENVDGSGVQGYLLVTPLNYSSPIVGNKVVISQETKHPVRNGSVSMNLDEGSQVNIQLWVEGGSSTVTSKRLDFNCTVPSVDSEIWELVNTPITSDLLDTSVLRVAHYLMSNPVYVAQLKNQVNYRGAWDANTMYFSGDVVSYDGGSFVYNSNTPQIGINPYDNSIWFQQSSKGGTGTGTGGNDEPYDSVGWDGQTDSPTRNAVRDLVENTLAKQSDVAGLAPLVDPVMINPRLSVDPAIGDTSSALVSSQWVDDRLANVLISGTQDVLLQGNPSCETPLTGDNSGRIATTAFVNQADAVVYSDMAVADAQVLTDSKAYTDTEIVTHTHSQYEPQDTGWLTIPSSWYGFGWSAYDQSTWLPRYRVKEGVVSLSGLMKRSPDTSNMVIMNLSNGLDPDHYIMGSVVTYHSSQYNFHRLDVATNGQVLLDPPLPVGTAISFVSLCEVIYLL